MKTNSSIVLFGSLVLATGCLNKESSTTIDTAESTVDSSDSTEAEGNLMMAAVDGSATTGLLAATGDQVAAKIAANIALRFPSGCATATASGANVVVKYNNCTGPRGLVHVTGELDLAISVALTGTISVHGTSTGLSVNGATLDVDANATYGVTGTTHTLAVQTNGSGVGPRGNAVDHAGNYTITWDTGSQCGSIAGHWSTEIGTATRSNDVDLMRCAGSCPSGTVVHKFLAGASLTLTFDGSSVAAWSGSNGKSGTVNLSCAAQ